MKHRIRFFWSLLTIIVLLALAPAAQGATTVRELGAAGSEISGAPLLAANPLIWRDDFNGSFRPEWTMVNDNPGEWSLDINPGFLTIWTSPAPTGEQNLLLRSAPAGDFTIQTRLLFQPAENFEIAGLVLWQNPDNFLQFGRAMCDLPENCVGNGIYYDNIQGGIWTGPNFHTWVENPGEAYLRLIRQGASIKAYYSDNGFDWMFIGEHILPAGFKINAVGLTSSQHPSGNPALPADFDYFVLNRVPSPFGGSWQAVDIDGGDIRLAIGAPRRGLYRVTWTESYFGFCGGEAGIARGVGWVSPDDPYLLEASLLLTCFTTGAQIDMHPVWRYDPSTGWMANRDDGFGGFITTWHRPGETLPLVWQNFLAHPDQEWVEGMGFPEGTVVSLLIRDSDGVRQFAGTAVAFHPPWDPNITTARFESLEGYDLKAGDHLWMSDGMVVKDHVVTILEVTETSFIEKTVWGIAEPFSEVIIEGFPVDEDPVMFSVFADPDGNWTAPVPWLTPGIDGLASQQDADGDMTRVTFSGLLPTFVAYVPGAIEGYDWPMGHTITVNINDGEYVAQAISEQRPGSPEGATRVLFEPWRDNFTIEAGDTIVMTDDPTSFTKDVLVTNLAVTGFDLSAGTVSGIYDPAYALWVWLYGQEGQVPATDPANGTWIATFAELPPGAWGGATQHDAEGDGTSLDFQVPMLLFVTSTADVLADDGACTLREAVIAANTNAPSGAAPGECPGGLEGVTDTILLADAATYSLTIGGSGEDDAYTGDLDIRDNSAGTDLVIRIDGGGSATISQDAAIDDRVLHVMATVEIEGLTITGGSEGIGGGVFNNGGILTLRTSTVSSSTASWQGGGIFNGAAGTLTLDSSVIADNVSSGFAGGVMNNGLLMVNNSEITGNADVYGGGGIDNEGTLTIDNSVLSANYSGQGGALYNTGTATITNSLIGGLGAGEGNSTYDGGGGLFNLGTMTVNNSTVAGNSAPYGGGLFNWIGGMLTINNTTVSNNLANQGGGLTTHENSTTVIQASSIIDNTAEWAGGGVNNWGTISITGSILNGNTSVIDVGSAINSDVNSDNAMSITGSCIAGNGGVAVFNSQPATQNATGNWWGAVDGPSGAGPGSGDSVGPNIDFSGWLGAPLPICAP